MSKKMNKYEFYLILFVISFSINLILIYNSYQETEINKDINGEYGAILGQADYSNLTEKDKIIAEGLFNSINEDYLAGTRRIIFKYDISKDSKLSNPEFVNIGADSKNHNLLEPSAFKIDNLIKELKKFTKSISKENLSKIQNGGKFFSSQP